jgi:hypothetical protein
LKGNVKETNLENLDLMCSKSHKSKKLTMHDLGLIQGICSLFSSQYNRILCKQKKYCEKRESLLLKSFNFMFTLYLRSSLCLHFTPQSNLCLHFTPMAFFTFWLKNFTCHISDLVSVQSDGQNKWIGFFVDV